MNHSHKRPFVFTVRDFPLGCGTLTRFKSPKKGIKKPRTNYHVAAAAAEGTVPKQEQELKNPYQGHVSATRKPIGTSFKQETEFKTHDHCHVAAAPKPQGAKNSVRDPSREKVLEVLQHFKQVFRQLEQEKLRGTSNSLDGTNRIDNKTLAVLEKTGKRVNIEKRIGSVPGIKVGDEFQYKNELRVIGLHSKPMCGIDYMEYGEVKMATSIVVSEGYGYNDKFDLDYLVYTGEGGNVISKDKKMEDQRMVRGNLALANSMREKREVRVIRGEERWDRKGKRYVYDGLYLVDRYWLEKGVSGKSVYKFKLSRIPGQPPLTK